MFDRTLRPTVSAQPTGRNEELLRQCPSFTAPYRLPRWLCNGHVETLFAAFFRKPLGLKYKRRLLTMPDGGTVALDSLSHEPGETEPTLDAPVLLLLPGLTGGSEGSYVQHEVQSAAVAGMRPVVMNMRGTSGQPVATAKFFSALYTDDVREVILQLRKEFPQAPLFALGWSNGANVLTNYLGEEGDATPLAAAAALCNPFDLTMCHEALTQGFSKIYNMNLAGSLRDIFRKHSHLFEAAAAEGAVDYDTQTAYNCRTLADFDNAITSKTFGFADATAYYAAAGSAARVPGVAIPLLVVQAADDPIAVERAIPHQALQENPNTILVVTPTGGHLGWCSQELGLLGPPWPSKPTLEWFTAIQKVVLARADKMPASID